MNNVLNNICYVIKTVDSLCRGPSLIMQFTQRGPQCSAGAFWPGSVGQYVANRLADLPKEIVTIAARSGCYLSGEQRVSSGSQAVD